MILVRDDSSKKEIQDNVGGKALILTILECKGLEFEDVLLFNFFGSSSFGGHWNVVYEYMNENNLMHSKSSPHFDAAKRSILCSELKQLYVAITRTRQRLWIRETDYEASKPMFDYWKKLGLVQQRGLDSSLAHTMKAKCNAEDWRSQAIKLFNAGNFEMATMCFERAGDEFRQKWAKAAAYQSIGERNFYTDFEQARESLKQAAKIYESIRKMKSAANCFRILKEYKRADGSKGWPLKQFPQKMGHLMRAKLLAEKVSNDFYQSVCAEEIILSDGTNTTFSNLLLQCNAAQQLQNVRLEIFAARKLLDIHLDLDPSKFHCECETGQELSKQIKEVQSSKCISVETLIYSWDFWKKRIQGVLSYLQLIGEADPNECSLYADFCMTYFGVRRKPNENTFRVLNSKAYWCKETDADSLLEPQSMVQMKIHQFAYCARKFCASELLSVGMTLLEKLCSLHEFCSNVSQPLSCHGQVLIHMFNVARFLKESKHLHRQHPALREVESSLALAKRCFPVVIFPLEFVEGMMKSKVALRENEIGRRILEEILAENLNATNGCLTHGRIGWIVMLLFLTGRLTDNFYRKIKIRLNQMAPWKSFIEQLKTYLDTGLGRHPLLCKFQEALASTYADDWRKNDYMSPHCFMYLFECLVFLASSCLRHGRFYTTKSVLFEMVTCDVWKSSFVFHTDDPDADGKCSDIWMTNGEEKAFFDVNPVLASELYHQESAKQLAQKEAFEGKDSEYREIDAESPMQRQSPEEEIAGPDADVKSSDTISTKDEENACFNVKPESTPDLQQEIAGESTEVFEGESSEDTETDGQAPKQQRSQQEAGNLVDKDVEVASLESKIGEEFRCNVTKVLQFLAETADELLAKKETTKMWVETMRLSAKTDYYPLLLSRLLVAICLLYLNSGWDLSRAAELLCSKEIHRDLPKEFSKRLQRLDPNAIRDRGEFLRVAAEASNAVGNCLMVVSEVQKRSETESE